MSTGRELLASVRGIADPTERAYVTFVLAMFGVVDDDSMRMARGAWAALDDDELRPWTLAVMSVVGDD